MSDPVTVYAVFSDAGEAERIGRSMIEARLAACVNILGPCRSIYRWQGAIQTADETPALFKTRADTAGALVAAIVAAHSYDVPAVALWPIAAAAPDFTRWIAAESGTVS